MVVKKLLDSNPPSRKTKFPGMPRTDFADFLAETDHFIRTHPDILEAIEEDLDAHARAKKELRIKDQIWWSNQKGEISEEEKEKLHEEISRKDLPLLQGRPRTSGYVVFVVLACRGYHDRGLMSRSFQDFLYESRSIQVLFARRGKELPAPETLWELLDAITNQTRHEIHKAQCEQILERGLDDFRTMILDSTHVEANTAWPTDAGIILKLVERVWRNGNKLEDFGLDNFDRHWTETWIEKINKAVFRINTTDHKSTRKKQYKRVYKFANNAADHLDKERKKFEGKVCPEKLPPSRRVQLEEIRDQLRKDLSDLRKVISYSKKRVLEGGSTSSTEKVLSVGGDEDASYITKGSRDAFIGYRPQVARSGNGFVGCFHLPEGNANDAPLLVKMVEEWEEVTGVLPEESNGDDGYASREGVEEVQDMGVDLVSISGAKGKKILGEERYETDEYRTARRMRSSVESTISGLKNVYGFGEASRRGISSVQGELLEDVIAHNFFRKVQLKGEGRKKQREEKEPEAA